MYDCTYLCIYTCINVHNYVPKSVYICMDIIIDYLTWPLAYLTHPVLLTKLNKPSVCDTLIYFFYKNPFICRHKQEMSPHEKQWSTTNFLNMQPSINTFIHSIDKNCLAREDCIKEPSIMKVEFLSTNNYSCVELLWNCATTEATLTLKEGEVVQLLICSSTVSQMN